MNNINPMQLIQMIKGGQNPQQLMMSILEQQMQNTPMGANLATYGQEIIDMTNEIFIKLKRNIY